MRDSRAPDVGVHVPDPALALVCGRRGVVHRCRRPVSPPTLPRTWERAGLRPQYNPFHDRCAPKVRAPLTGRRAGTPPRPAAWSQPSASPPFSRIRNLTTSSAPTPPPRPLHLELRPTTGPRAVTPRGALHTSHPPPEGRLHTHTHRPKGVFTPTPTPEGRLHTHTHTHTQLPRG